MRRRQAPSAVARGLAPRALGAARASASRRQRGVAKVIAPPPGALATLPRCRRAARRPDGRSPGRGRCPGVPRRVGAAEEAVEHVRQVRPRRRRSRGRGRGRRRASTVTSTVPPGGEWRAALSSRLLIARPSRSGTPSTIIGSSVRLEPDARARCAAPARATPRRPGRAATSSVSPAGWSPRASSIRSPTSALSSSLCSTTSASNRAAVLRVELAALRAAPRCSCAGS